MLDLITKVLYSNDKISRSITLKVIAILAKILNNRMDIYHQVILNINF